MQISLYRWVTDKIKYSQIAQNSELVLLPGMWYSTQTDQVIHITSPFKDFFVLLIDGSLIGTPRQLVRNEIKYRNIHKD